MELKETISGMTSADYKERFIAEYQQTNIRYQKLKHFCNTIEATNITGIDCPEHQCPLDLLREQQKIMGNYLHILEIRAIIENIVL